MYRVVDLRHGKEPQAEIRASEQNLSDFSRSMSEATLKTKELKSDVKPNNYNNNGNMDQRLMMGVLSVGYRSSPSHSIVIEKHNRPQFMWLPHDDNDDDDNNNNNKTVPTSILTVP